MGSNWKKRIKKARSTGKPAGELKDDEKPYTSDEMDRIGRYLLPLLDGPYVWSLHGSDQAVQSIAVIDHPANRTVIVLFQTATEAADIYSARIADVFPGLEPHCIPTAVAKQLLTEVDFLSVFFDGQEWSIPSNVALEAIAGYHQWKRNHSL